MVTALVLAGGESKRFGSPKALARFGDETALSLIVKKASEAGFSKTIVVLGGYANVIQKSLKDLPCSFVINSKYQLGQLSSLQEGIRVLKEEDQAVGLFLVDQPLIKVETIQWVLKKFQEGSNEVVRPIFRGRGGHPTIFSQKICLNILQLDPNRHTTKDALLKGHKVFDIEVSDHGVLLDFDTVEDYNSLISL